MHARQALDHFEQAFKQQVAMILHHAKGCAPGGVGGDWQDVVAHFGLPAQSNAQRAAAAGQAGHTRGALPDEVEGVLRVLSQQASQVLANMGHVYGPHFAADPGAASQLGELQRHVAETPTEQRRAYAGDGKPKGAGVAGIFANAAATAALAPWASANFDRHFTLQCPGCGSPQRTRLRFDCEYCGASLFAAVD